MTDDAPEQAPASRGRVSSTEYAEFIGQIELAAIWLDRATITNHHGPETPRHGAFHVRTTARWQPHAGGFDAFHHYIARLEATEALLAEIDVTFALRFASSRPMSDRLFEVFRDVNLPVNTWPYLREFVSTMMGRFHWQPFTLPTLKRGVLPPPPDEAGRPAPRPRRRRAAAAS